MKTWSLGAAAASVLLVGLAACKGGTSGTTGGASTTATGGTGGATGTGGNAPGCGTTQYSTSPQCESCMESNCCSELLSCTGGTPCDGLLKCLVANNCTAGDPTCITTCENANSAGVPFVMALNNCFDNSCSMQSICQTGAICQSGLKVQNVQCGMCLGTSCCAEWTACGADMVCSACATSQGANSGCSHYALYTAATTCESSNCAQDCTAICNSGLTTNNPACDLCLTANCCGAFEACIDDSTCDTCLLSSGQGPTCQTDATYVTADTCQSTNCASECTSGG
jgi:hypothetical protein